jgi:hypothetical protein
MTMPGNIASTEFTTLERCEWLLSCIACTVTRKPAHELLPWVRSGIQELGRSLNG